MILNLLAGGLPKYLCTFAGAAKETITVKDKNGRLVGTVTTDEKGIGKSSLTLRKGRYTLAGSVSGHTETVNVNAAGRYMAMPSGATILYWFGYCPYYKEGGSASGNANKKATYNTNNIVIHADAEAWVSLRADAHCNVSFGSKTVKAGQKLYAMYKAVSLKSSRWNVGLKYNSTDGGTFTGTSNNTTYDTRFRVSSALTSKDEAMTLGIGVFAEDGTNSLQYKSCDLTLRAMYIL